MISRYDGICCYCKDSTKAGKDEYDTARKVSFHRECEQNQAPGPDAVRVAQELGYLLWEDALRVEWSRMRFLPSSDSGDIERGTGKTRGFFD